MSKARALGPTDWIKAAFRALTEGGAPAVRVERLARELGVTKGSFYWHFRDLPALQAAMLDHWQEVATESIIRSVQVAGADLKDTLVGLFSDTIEAPAVEYGGALAELAIREWARQHEGAAAALARVDARRLSFLTAQLETHGIAPKIAGQRAALFYAALIGAEQLSATAPLSRETVGAFVEGLLGDPGHQAAR